MSHCQAGSVCPEVVAEIAAVAVAGAVVAESASAVIVLGSCCLGLEIWAVIAEQFAVDSGSTAETTEPKSGFDYSPS